jgi:uncharacterized protein YecE (DUF72 family)
MTWLPGFDPEPARPPLAAKLAPRLAELARQGIYLGTSSWKYEGWLGSIYSAERYQSRGSFSQSKFEAECLREYAQTFPIVCGDFSFYQFPSHSYWERLFGQTPESLLFAFKVPEEVTVHTWPAHGRYGQRAGKPNEHFLDAALFDRAFARALRPYETRVATLIFEFGTIPKKAIATPGEFFSRLATFLVALPPGFRYAVEIRNPEYLGESYFSMLTDQRVAHVFNAWTRMPELSEQLSLPGAFTTDFSVVRALLAKGRTYEKAVSQFEPYRLMQEPNPPARKAMRRVLDRARRTGGPAFLFVNNRLEGFAPGTIFEVVSGDDD